MVVCIIETLPGASAVGRGRRTSAVGRGRLKPVSSKRRAIAPRAAIVAGER
jgi:hypothetical protein